MDIIEQNSKDIVSLKREVKCLKEFIKNYIGKDHTKFIWIAYADDDVGTNFSFEPQKENGDYYEYLGMAYNKDLVEPSTNYREYSWSKYIGEGGGGQVEDVYTWSIYSKYENGITDAGFVDVSENSYNFVDKEYYTYLGLKYNQKTLEQPNYNNMTSEDFRNIGFKWSRIRGIDGKNGVDGLDGNNGVAGPFLAPMGRWDETKAYQGTLARIETVLYNNQWYVTLPSAGIIPIGTLPTDTRYWLQSERDFSFIATDLLLAQTAYIENLGVRNIRTNDSGARIDILEDTNTLKFFLNNKTAPAISLGAQTIAGDFMGSKVAVEKSVVEVRGKVRAEDVEDRTSYVSNSGAFSNGSNISFLPSSSGASTSASIVGLNQNTTEIDDPVTTYNGYPIIKSGSFRAGVAGIHQNMSNEGRTFGGYFNTILSSGKYQVYTLLDASVSYSATVDCSMYLCTLSTGVATLNLPLMGTLSSTTNTWNSALRVGFIVEVVLVNSGGDVKVVSGNGNVIINTSGSSVGEVTLSDRGTMKLMWIGNNWIILN